MEQRVREKLESGGYNSASEVVDETLRLLRERDELRQARLEDLRREVRVGLQQLDEGQYTTYDDGSLEELIQEVRTAGREAVASCLP
jgi:antitoxin ParD1/3/4